MLRKILNFNKSGKKNNTLNLGLAYGAGGALVLVLVVLSLIFLGSGRSFGDWFGRDRGLAGDSTATKLRATVISHKGCEPDKCYSLEPLFDAIKEANGNFVSLDTVYAGSRAADDLIKKYNIDRVPALLITGELEENPQLAQFWPLLGEVIDGVFIFREVIPPFIELSSGQLKEGIFSITYLTDDSCADCYDVYLHENALFNLGMDPREGRAVDVSSAEGKLLIDQYQIKFVPTILLKGELDVYSGLQEIWSFYGEVADDGTYIFTGMDVMGNYRDLTNNQVIKVE